MDKVSGKYLGVNYTWKHEGVMKLYLQFKNSSRIIESKYNMNHQKDKKAYDAYTEICIDQALLQMESEKSITDFMRRETKNG